MCLIYKWSMLSIQVPQIIPGKENLIMPKLHIYIIKMHIFNFLKYFIINLSLIIKTHDISI